MKKISLILFIALLSSALQAQTIRKIKMNDLLKRIDTTSVPLVVNFWATWCGPCVRELPWFEKNVAAMKEKKIKLLLVSLDYAGDYPKGIAAFAKRNGIVSEIIWLDETNPDDFCPKLDKRWQGTIPVSLMVNHTKNYRHFYNQQLPEPKLLQELNKLVE
jgi:thiol-disulfide isomerase/thioredoxin